MFDVASVVLATGVESDKNLRERMKGIKMRAHTIGDCNEPREILSAIHEGFRVAMSI